MYALCEEVNILSRFFNYYKARNEYKILNQIKQFSIIIKCINYLLIYYQHLAKYYLMEENRSAIPTLKNISRQISLNKSSQHSRPLSQNLVQTPQQKITNLQHLIQSYLTQLNTKKLQSLLPTIERVQQGIQNKQNELQELSLVQVQISQKQLLELYQIRKKLIQELKTLAKDVQCKKQIRKNKKVERIQIQEELVKNLEIYKQLQNKNQELNQKKLNMKQKTSPNTTDHTDSKNDASPDTGRKLRAGQSRISGFNYDLHHANPTKNERISITPKKKAVQNSQKQQKSGQCIYNTINYQRIKEIQKLLDQITMNSSNYKFEKLLIGDAKESIVKKVFKNFSIKEYFDAFISKRKVFKFLESIQNL